MQPPPSAPPAKAEEPAKAPVAAASIEPAPAVKETPPQPKHKDEKSAAVTPRQEGVPFVIQLGAFANPANAKERQSRLTALKVKFYTETVKTASGDKLRVRAGPYATRQEAERVQAKLRAAGIQDGVVAEKK
jgi:DedD protein